MTATVPYLGELLNTVTPNRWTTPCPGCGGCEVLRVYENGIGGSGHTRPLPPMPAHKAGGHHTHQAQRKQVA
ncbi:hypothetical protein [Kibdelosporangium phytohabitans]|nr:hypothetical protein [Kibdelosporangium phytohabitans]MBE1471400.1 hypothetical protein [Kibdelosporangium phytohabitans]